MVSQSWLGRSWQLGLVGSLMLAGTLAGVLSEILWDSFTSSAFAQIVPDATLDKPSIVAPFPFAPTVNSIRGGTARGVNLFHSFREFNVEAGQYAFFISPDRIENILARVTGTNPSQILGTLGSSGSSNLFLINPNGIIFGRDARLDVGGSFMATTANAIAFGDRGVFSASAPEVPSQLLTVNPSALFFNQRTAGAIAYQAVAPNLSISSIAQGLRVREGKSLLLVGGDVSLDGGIVQALGGRVELAGVAGAGTVELNVDSNLLRLNFPDSVARADISLTNEARVLTNGSGEIQLSGRRVAIANGSQIVANNVGSGAGGTLAVSASDSVSVMGTSAKGGSSGLFTQARGGGPAGDLTIKTGTLTVRDGAQISAGTSSGGKGGTLTVNAFESVELSGTTPDGQSRSGLFTQTTGAGDAGDLTVKTRRLMARDGAVVSTSTFGKGRGGTLLALASESVELSGTSASAGNLQSSGLFAVTEGGFGAAGDLRIETGRLIVRDGAVVTASTFGGSQGRGGKLAAIASESVELNGTAPNGEFRSGLFVGTEGTEAAGDLTVETGRLIVRNGAVVSAGTSGKGEGGTLTVRASESVQLQGTSADGRFASSLLAEAIGTGTGGDLKIETGQLLVRDGATVTVSSQGLGDAGNLEIAASSIELNNRAALSATTKSGNGGDISLRVRDLLLLRGNSNISTTAGTAQAGGDGGNINIDTKFLIAVPSENSDIAANAFTGNGGSVKVTAQGIFGIAPRDRPTLRSDITASSERGVSGTIELYTPDVDPSQGLVNLPTDVVDASRQIAQSCAGSGGATARKQSEFFIIGRGGLPPNPSEAIATDVVWQDLRLPARRTAERAAEPVAREEIGVKPAAVSSSSFVEAQGWVIGSDGRVILTAQAPNVTPQSPGLTSPSCQNEPRP